MHLEGQSNDVDDETRTAVRSGTYRLICILKSRLIGGGKLCIPTKRPGYRTSCKPILIGLGWDARQCGQRFVTREASIYSTRPNSAKSFLQRYRCFVCRRSEESAAACGYSMKIGQCDVCALKSISELTARRDSGIACLSVYWNTKICELWPAKKRKCHLLRNLLLIDEVDSMAAECLRFALVVETREAVEHSDRIVRI